MIQGGDYSCRKVNPGKVEKFDVDYTVPAEIIYPKYYHKRGQLCAAREGDDENPTKASASTDFYITWGRNFSPRQMEYYVEKEKREGKSYAIPSAELQQGYIKYGGVPHLDNGYTVFGEVLEGMDVVDKIQNVATNKENNDRPLEDIVITKATQVK
jgi:cyclophilin family peptidyl-prolyl cis-trans isomerase